MDSSQKGTLGFLYGLWPQKALDVQDRLYVLRLCTVVAVGCEAWVNNTKLDLKKPPGRFLTLESHTMSQKLRNLYHP